MQPSYSQPRNLRVEYLETPLGIDVPQPRFSWQETGSGNDNYQQEAYRVCLATDPSSLKNQPLWTSGRQHSPGILTSYSGPELQSFTRYYWSVETWGRDGKKSEAVISTFETGMMHQSDWQGSWISDRYSKDEKRAPLFRRSFINHKKIKSARAYIAVAGLYEMYVNGKRIGDHQLDPMYTRFDRRNLYVTYDITDHLLPGENVVGVELGNGWYNHQSTAVWFFDQAPWRNRPAFCMDIRLMFEDGSTETIGTGREWRWTLGPTLFNSIYTAEHYDARLEQPGWNKPGFADSTWHGPIYRSAPSGNIVAQSMQPIRITREIPAVNMKKFSDSNYVFDIGENIAGISSIQVSGKPGTVIRVKHGELLDSLGHVDLSNIIVHYRPKDSTDPFQEDIYILSGNGREFFMPKFNYKGFQYIEVSSDQPISLQREDVKGYFMHSDVKPIGKLHTSDPVINKIWAATNQSYLSNLFGYPTDCPQREKNGWTGDAAIAVETGLYNFDGITVYEKWLADHRDEQQPNGVLPSIIPTGGWGYEWGNGPDWTSTIAVIPWNIYLFYGDAQLLKKSYGHIKSYVNYIDRISPTGITTWGLGDWVPVKSRTPVALTSTAYYYADVKILATAAKLFGKSGDWEHYNALAEKIKTAFHKEFYNAETGVYADGVQTALSVPLFWGIVPDSLQAKIAAKLAERVAADNYHLDVGLLGTKAILNALSQNGYADVAYKIAAQRDFPSWGWWIQNGATTLFENWPLDATSDISKNHIMFGEIGAWLFKGIGGIIPVAEHPGFEQFYLKPHFVTGLDSYESSYQSRYGEIISTWKRKKKKIDYHFSVPPGAKALIQIDIKKGQKIIENGHKVEISGSDAIERGSGDYHWEIK